MIRPCLLARVALASLSLPAAPPYQTYSRGGTIAVAETNGLLRVIYRHASKRHTFRPMTPRCCQGLLAISKTSSPPFTMSS